MMWLYLAAISMGSNGMIYAILIKPIVRIYLRKLIGDVHKNFILIDTRLMPVIINSVRPTAGFIEQSLWSCTCLFTAYVSTL